MNLRMLRKEDAPLMLEWMHDRSVVEHLATNFQEKTIEDCLSFVENAQMYPNNLHWAIVNDSDEYMGTVSLKNLGEGCGEFAITVRKCAMGKGYSRFAMDEILEYGSRELNLNGIYWCVSPKNVRAVRFYDKNGYHRTQVVPDRIKEHYSQELIWYVYY